VIHITSSLDHACHSAGTGRRCPNTRAGRSGRTAQVNPDLTYGPAAHAVAGPFFARGRGCAGSCWPPAGLMLARRRCPPSWPALCRPSAHRGWSADGRHKAGHDGESSSGHDGEGRGHEGEGRGHDGEGLHRPAKIRSAVWPRGALTRLRRPP